MLGINRSVRRTRCLNCLYLTIDKRWITARTADRRPKSGMTGPTRTRYTLRGVGEPFLQDG
jgi:hypothetical protein